MCCTRRQTASASPTAAATAAATWCQTSESLQHSKCMLLILIFVQGGGAARGWGRGSRKIACYVCGYVKHRWEERGQTRACWENKSISVLNAGRRTKACSSKIFGAEEEHVVF